MLPMETSVTFIGACANEIIRRNNSGFFNKGKECGHVRILVIMIALCVKLFTFIVIVLIYILITDLLYY